MPSAGIEFRGSRLLKGYVRSSKHYQIQIQKDFNNKYYIVTFCIKKKFTV